MSNRPDVGRVRTIRLPTSSDPRGNLTVIEGSVDTPFEVKRLFYMWGVQAPYERGRHAHQDTELVLMCIAGSLSIDLSDPTSSCTYRLEDPAEGLYIPALIWTFLYDFTPETVCLAAASTHYDPSKVLRDWDEYCRIANAR